MFGLQVIDIVIILIYFTMMIWIGYRAMKKIKNREDYFLAGRQFGKLIQTFAAFGQATSAETGVTTTTMVRYNGAAGIWAGLAGGLIAMPVLWMTSVWYRRMRVLTLADFFEERYGSKAMAAFYSVFQGIFLMIVVALAFNALGKTMAAIIPRPVEELTPAERQQYEQAEEIKKLEQAEFDSLTNQQKKRLQDLRLLNPKGEFSYVNQTVLIIIVAAIVLLYAVSGGLEAAFVTDTIQGIFTIILTVLLIPFAIVKLNNISGTSGLMGVFEALHKKLPESFFELWGSPLVIEFTWYWTVAFGLLAMINVAVQANQLTACGSAKDEYTARYGFVSGIFLKRYSQVVWGFVALVTVALYSDAVKNPDYMWGYAVRDLLGSMGIGLVGLMIACMMAALMSMADCFMITSSSLMTNNVYRIIKPDRSENHYIGAGRLFAIIFMIGSVVIALQFKTVFALFKLIFMFNCVLAASFWLGMLWRRADRIGAWTSMLVTTLFTVALPVVIPLFPGARTNDYLFKTTNPLPMTRSYLASEMDVAERQESIAKWEQIHAKGLAQGKRPEPLLAGQKFKKTFILPKKSIFWAEDFDFEDGVKKGSGMLKVELVMLDMLGFDLSKNSYSFNETLTALFRIIVPFVALIVVSLLTPADNKQMLDRFYVKMKTEVQLDRTSDAREMTLSYENPHRFDHLKLLPNSSWEFGKWSAIDFKGAIWSIVGSVGCFLILYLIVRLK